MAQFVLQQQPFPPGVAAKVEHLGQEALLLGAGGEGEAESLQRGWGETGQEDGGVTAADILGQFVPLLLEVEGRRGVIGPVGVEHRRCQHRQDAQHAGGIALLLGSPLRCPYEYLLRPDDDVVGAGDQDAVGDVAAGGDGTITWGVNIISRHLSSLHSVSARVWMNRRFPPWESLAEESNSVKRSTKI
ncbi:hypothetical protein DRJ54_07345 [Candidatus Acetothermia bacterium]|nr:MAG: hypothetical protein DRJ54_07345 [Candidatus Acetothermia bacterium]